MCISPTQNELEQKNNSNNTDNDDDSSSSNDKINNKNNNNKNKQQQQTRFAYGSRRNTDLVWQCPPKNFDGNVAAARNLECNVAVVTNMG